MNHKWVKKNLASIENKPVIFFPVSGASPGSKLDGWIADSLQAHFISQVKHVLRHAEGKNQGSFPG